MTQPYVCHICTKIIFFTILFAAILIVIPVIIITILSPTYDPALWVSNLYKDSYVIKILLIVNTIFILIIITILSPTYDPALWVSHLYRDSNVIKIIFIAFMIHSHKSQPCVCHICTGIHRSVPCILLLMLISRSTLLDGSQVKRSSKLTRIMMRGSRNTWVITFIKSETSESLVNEKSILFSCAVLRLTFKNNV